MYAIFNASSTLPGSILNRAIQVDVVRVVNDGQTGKTDVKLLNAGISGIIELKGKNREDRRANRCLSDPAGRPADRW